MLFFGIVPTEIIRNHLYKFLDLRDIMNLDESVIDMTGEYMLQSLNGCSLRSEKIDDVVLEWVVHRRIKLDTLLVGPVINHTTIHLVRKYPYNCDVVLEGDASAIKRPSRISSAVPNLITSLDISECENAGDALVMSLIQQGSHIEKVNLTFSRITEASLISFAKWCPLLKSLDVSMCQKLSGTGVKAILEGCPLLEGLKLLNSSITGKIVLSTALHCPQLKSVSFQNCNTISDNEISALANCARGLVEVNCARTAVTDAGLLVLTQCCPGMKEIDLTKCDVSHEALVTAFGNWKGLVSMRLEGCENVRDDTVHVLVQSCSCLQDINLYDCLNITDDATKAIADNFPGLGTLTLTNCQQLTDTGLLYLLSKCTALKRLMIGNGHLTGVSLSAVAAHCHQLSVLGISGFSSLPEGPMLDIAGSCEYLKKLFLGRDYEEWRLGGPLREAFLALRPGVQIMLC